MKTILVAYDDTEPSRRRPRQLDRQSRRGARADLVVIGTRGLGPLQRLLGQSVSQAVSRRVATC